VRVGGGGGWGIVRVGHDGKVSKMAGAWRHWDRILLCFEFNFCFKAVPVSWDRILLSFEFNCCCPVSWELYFFWIQEDSKMADASSGCCCLSGVKAVPSDLGAELSNCQDILPFLTS